MSILSIEEKMECYKNLLSDPDDWISRNLLALNGELEALKMAGVDANAVGGGDCPLRLTSTDERSDHLQ